MDNNLQMIGRAVDYIEEHLTEDYRGNRVFQISSAQNVYVCCGHSHSQVYPAPQADGGGTDACIYSKTPDRYRTVLWLRHPAFFFKEL